MLLSPDTRDRLDRISLHVRGRVRGKWSGRHASVQIGDSVDFADYREYIRGDDIRHIDWNIYSRLDRLFLKMFLEEQDLIDLPEHETLYTALSPSHFAGAAVGGVYSAGPFDPEAETLFYLPTVPDSAPDEAKNGFYRSFNTFFNTMIITHEIYPGHYLQLKVAAHHPSRIRALFTGDDFTEGWASFVEQMTLDHGFDGDQPLTRMAHLRKRLENAVRAYVSVQVHCRGWGAEELGAFAVETGLLPPQFAENLWQRALLSPIQLPSYFIGFRVFDEVYRGAEAAIRALLARSGLEL